MVEIKEDAMPEYANPKCYAKDYRNCSHEKSGEHFLSKVLLKLLEVSGKMTIQGPAWLPKDEERYVTANSLKSNVLCKKHNSELSYLDNTAFEFCNFLLDFRSQKRNLSLENDKVERWMLKMLCGFSSSGFLKGFKGWLPSKEWLDILFLGKGFPDGSGLYYLSSNKRLEAKSNELGVWPVPSDDLKEIIGLHFLLAGYTFLFMMRQMTKSFLERHIQNGFTPIYRPEAFQIEYANYAKLLNLDTHTGEIITLRVTSE